MEQGRWRMAGPAQGTQSKAIYRWGARLLLALASDDVDSGSTIPPFKAEASPVEVVWNRLEPDPSSAQALRGFASGATAGKGVQDQVACFGQKLYEELGELNREAGWVGLDFFFRTAREVYYERFRLLLLFLGTVGNSK